METMRTCPSCGEEIRAAAIRCRYCRSRLAALDPALWSRDHPERLLAGVTAAVGHALAVPTAVVRVGFLVLTFFHFLGPALYLALWLLVPFAPGGSPPLARAAVRLRNVLDGLGGAGSERASRRAPPDEGEEERGAPPAPPRAQAWR